MILDKSKLENILLANWANFLNPNEVMKFTLSCVRDNVNTFLVMEESELPKKSVQILVSRFNILEENGFQLWIDFTVPKNDEILVGTVEAYLEKLNNLKLISVVGNRFIKQLPKS